MPRFGSLSHLGLNLSQAADLTGKLVGNVHHDKVLATLRVQRKDFELVACCQHSGPNHGVTHDGVKKLSSQ